MVEDVYAISYRGREFQGLLRYGSVGAHLDRVDLDPRLKYGVAPNWQAKLSLPFVLGSAEKTGGDDVILEVFYNVNADAVRITGTSQCSFC